MGLWVLRGLLILVTFGVSFSAVTSAGPLQGRAWFVPLVMGGALIIVIADMLIPRKRIEFISATYVGIVVALFLTYLIGGAMEPLLYNANMQPSEYRAIIQVLLAVALSYICISLLLQTKDDFRFIIPYVEFSKEVKGLRPFLLDTSVVIDGRIADVVETQILDSELIMPRFILAELQAIADSGDKLRRSRGRRGLDILNRLRTNEDVDLKIYDRETPEMEGQPVDMKLVLLAKHLDGKIVTGDYNLNKIAKLQSVPVINLNDIANALKPVYLPGESFNVRVMKPGEESGQGIGYLDDGTMVVVENGRDHIGRTVRISVTSVIQKSAGRMIFGRFEAGADAPAP